ncbi:DUF359 domain-containing protein [Stetteria hydrogenophila]
MTPWAPALLLPPELRGFFATPRGLLARDPSAILGSAAMAVCVGDHVSRLCESLLGPSRSSIVFDGRSGRREAEPPSAAGYRLVEAWNPAGSITLEARAAVCEASRQPGVAVRVKGEEDMLALVALECASPGSLVAYGLPGRGVVVLRTTRRESADAADSIMNLRLGAVRSQSRQ